MNCPNCGEFLSEEFLSERTIEVPGGTAKIITGVQSDLFKNQSVFVEFEPEIEQSISETLSELQFMDEEGDFEDVEFIEEEIIEEEIIEEEYIEDDEDEDDEK